MNQLRAATSLVGSSQDKGWRLNCANGPQALTDAASQGSFASTKRAR